VADLPIPELVENRRRSIAMLPVGAPALNRDEALELLEQLKAELVECVCPPPNGPGRYGGEPEST
jgi:hypothetical protein